MNGYTLMHEHITIDLSGIKKDTDCQLDSKSSMSAASAPWWTSPTTVWAAMCPTF